MTYLSDLIGLTYLANQIGVENLLKVLMALGAVMTAGGCIALWRMK